MSFLVQVSELLVGSIDYKGQEKADFILVKLVRFFAITAFIVGFLNQNILYTVYTFAAGLIIAALAVIPPYKFYNQNNLTFLKVNNKDNAILSENVSSTVIEAPIN